MKGLYFYKLVSPYEEDVTKDCKLTINEIDHNFVTLKDADIKEVSFDKESKIVSLLKNNKEEMRLDLSPMVEGITTNLKVDYDSVDGVITIEYNGEIIRIDGLITEDNLSSEVLTEVTNDGTLSGLGSKYVPMGIAAVEKTGSYKPAYKLIDRTIGEQMPNTCHLIKGDRYVTLEEVSEFGYLYNFSAVKKINEDLKNGWRIPTKEDWDNMLNAIEPCEEYRNHNSALANNMLGKLAGRYLKSKEHWINYDGGCHYNDSCCRSNSCDYEEELIDSEEFDEFNIYDNSPKSHPNHCNISTNGIDSYGMGLVPSGFNDGCQVVDYFGKRGFYWSSSVINETDVYVKRFDYNKAGVVQNVESPRNFFSLRLVKDYDGSNNLQTEFINGMNYNTILMPALNTKHGHSIWTAENVAFKNDKYCPVEPNNGEGLSSKKVYFINEWNGFDWERKQLHEGDSIVLMKGLKGEKNIEYRVIDGVLYSVSKAIYDDIMSEIQPEIDRIDGIIGSGFTDENGERVSITEIIGSGFTDENGERVTITDKVKDIDSTLGTGFTDATGEKVSVTDKLKQEISDREEADRLLREALEKEIANRVEGDKELREDLDEEIRQREEADTLLQENIDKVEESVGLDEDGNYVPKENANYIEGATTIADSISKLDDALRVEENSRKDQDNIIEENVGLDKNGQYIIKENSNYIAEATTIANSIDILDQELNGTNYRLELLTKEVDRVENSTGLDDMGNYHPTEGKFTSGATTIKGAIEDLDTSLEIEEESRIAQDDKIEGSVGLEEDGSYLPTEGKFTSEATTIKEGIVKLDAALESEESSRIAQDDTIEGSVGLAEDGSHIKTNGNYTSEANTITEEISALDSELKTEEDARKELQEELDRVEAATGLDKNGNYVKTEGNYTSEAETVVGAIDSLDKALKVEETERIAQDDKIEGSVGLAEDGSYVKTEGNYTSEAETVVGAIDSLDKALKVEETERIEKDEYLFSRLIKEGEQPNEAPDKISYDCANGVLTLFTEDPSHNVKIKLNGDYGIFPYTEKDGD